MRKQELFLAFTYFLQTYIFTQKKTHVDDSTRVFPFHNFKI